MFDVLGFDGYSLHQEIVSFGKKPNEDRQSLNGQVSQAAILPENTTNVIVGMILSENTAYAANQYTVIPGEAPSTKPHTFSIKSSKINDSSQRSSSAFDSDGKVIAAAAATTAAAAKKKSSPEGGLGEGGIAAAAAAAAAAKKKKSSSATPTVDQSSSVAPTSVSCSTVDAHAVDSEVTVLSSNLERDLLASVMETGALEASCNPRDLPSFYCLYLVAKRLEQVIPESREDTVVFEEKKQEGLSRKGKNKGATRSLPDLSKILLLRSLAIINQATSIGMVGWLEYGTSNQLERTPSLPFKVLQQLACSFAASEDWGRASDVLNSLVMRCEQHLPLYHPTTLTSMLDLSAALTFAFDYSLAKGIVQRVSDLLAMYLSEHEAIYFERCRSYLSFENDDQMVFQHDDGTDVISLIKAFATAFHDELSREFLALIGPNHKITLLNHAMVADSFAVLANCLSAGEESIVATKKKKGSSPSGNLSYWSLAFMHYERAWKGWVKIETLSHPNAVSAAYSVARCLRELGRLDQALKVLGALVSSVGVERSYDTSPSSDETGSNESPYSTLTFLPPRSLGATRGEMSFSVSTCRAEQLTVLCLWMMAVMTVDQSPDERGRIRALSLLQKASESLRRALERIDEMDEITRRVCLELYECVEEEARLLFEPLLLIHLPPEEDTTTTAPQIDKFDVLSPMRRRRWREEHWNKLLGQRDQNPAAAVKFI